MASQQAPLAFSSAGTLSPSQLPAMPASPGRAQTGVRDPEPQHPTIVLQPPNQGKRRQRSVETRRDSNSVEISQEIRGCPALSSCTRGACAGSGHGHQPLRRWRLLETFTPIISLDVSYYLEELPHLQETTTLALRGAPTATSPGGRGRAAAGGAAAHLRRRRRPRLSPLCL